VLFAFGPRGTAVALCTIGVETCSHSVCPLETIYVEKDSYSCCSYQHSRDIPRTVTRSRQAKQNQPKTCHVRRFVGTPITPQDCHSVGRRCTQQATQQLRCSMNTQNLLAGRNVTSPLVSAGIWLDTRLSSNYPSPATCIPSFPRQHSQIQMNVTNSFRRTRKTVGNDDRSQKSLDSVPKIGANKRRQRQWRGRRWGRWGRCGGCTRPSLARPADKSADTSSESSDSPTVRRRSFSVCPTLAWRACHPFRRLGWGRSSSNSNSNSNSTSIGGQLGPIASGGVARGARQPVLEERAGITAQLRGCGGWDHGKFPAIPASLTCGSYIALGGVVRCGAVWCGTVQV